uniref:C2H2-type domain-containing protein n=1 Tax=Timema shepardi TaxID=629360 RepID=A0A7R9FUX3_TIMSH|nr:unnamed protein product [Timema shepardi]
MESLHSETLDEERDADFEEGDCRCIVCSREFPELEHNSLMLKKHQGIPTRGDSIKNLNP